MSNSSVGILGYEKAWNSSYGLDRDPVRMHLVYPWIVENLASLDDKVILDAGCGNGSLAYFLKKYKFDSYTGIDLSDIFLNYAISNVIDNRVTFQKRDLLSRWKFSNKTFDIVFAIFVINELNNLNFFFSEIKRVLKDNGTAIIFLTHPFLYMYYPLKEKFTGKANEKFPGLSGYFNFEKVAYNFTLSEASATIFPYTLSDVFNSIASVHLFPVKVSELTTDDPKFFLISSYKDTKDIPKFLALKLMHCN